MTCHTDIQNFQYDMSCYTDMSFNVIYSTNFNSNFWVKFRDKIKSDEIVHLSALFHSSYHLESDSLIFNCIIRKLVMTCQW